MRFKYPRRTLASTLSAKIQGLSGLTVSDLYLTFACFSTKDLRVVWKTTWKQLEKHPKSTEIRRMVIAVAPRSSILLE